MKKSTAFTNHVNRNTNLLAQLRNRIKRNNIVAPEIVVRHIWMQEDEPQGVEIIELNESDNTSEESIEDRPVKYSQAWSYINNASFGDNDSSYYQRNEAARERRRAQNIHEITYTNNNNCVNNYSNDSEDSYSNEDYVPVPTNPRSNCITIHNNRAVKSDSSSDDEYAIGLVETQNLCKRDWDHEICNDNNERKRMIWFYSFGNRRLLSEHDYELVDKPGRDSDSSSPASSPSSDDRNNDKCIGALRIASPIPTSYIPRLDLSIVQTLSTVTEVSSKKTSDSSEETIKHRKSKHRSLNSLDWMSLSPRDKICKYKNNEAVTDYNKRYKFAKDDDEINKFIEDLECREIRVDVDVHAEQPAADNKAKVQEITSEEKKVKDAQSSESIYDESSDVDDNYKIDRLKAPQIVLNTKTPSNASPIERLESNNWIEEERINKEKSDDNNKTNVFNNSLHNDNNYLYNNNNGDGNEDNVSKRLFLQNMKLIKPAAWTDYLPIATSQNSLHLSLSCSSIPNKQAWYKWLYNMFTCCKSDL